MDILRAWTVCAVLLAGAFGASDALAAHGTAVELTNEGTGEHCTLAPANCMVKAHTETPAIIEGHLFGFESTDSECHEEVTSKEWELGDSRCQAVQGTGAHIEVTGHWYSEDAESDDLAVVHL